MTDVSDQATELEESMREQAVARQRAASDLKRAASANTPAAEDCTECGDPIPLKRRKAAPGCTRCIKCEQTDEALRKLGKR